MHSSSKIATVLYIDKTLSTVYSNYTEILHTLIEKIR